MLEQIFELIKIFERIQYVEKALEKSAGVQKSLKNTDIYEFLPPEKSRKELKKEHEEFYKPFWTEQEAIEQAKVLYINTGKKVYILPQIDRKGRGTKWFLFFNR